MYSCVYIPLTPYNHVILKSWFCRSDYHILFVTFFACFYHPHVGGPCMIRTTYEYDVSKIFREITKTTSTSGRHLCLNAKRYSVTRVTFCFKSVIPTNLKLACFVYYLQIINTFFFKNNVCIKSEIAQGTQKWHWHFSQP